MCVVEGGGCVVGEDALLGKKETGLGKMTSEEASSKQRASCWGSEKAAASPTSIAWLREMNLKINLINFLDWLHEVMLSPFQITYVGLYICREAKCRALALLDLLPSAVLTAARITPPNQGWSRKTKPEHFSVQLRQLGKRGLCLIIPDGPQFPRARGDTHPMSLPLLGIWAELPKLMLGGGGYRTEMEIVGNFTNGISKLAFQGCTLCQVPSSCHTKLSPEHKLGPHPGPHPAHCSPKVGGSDLRTSLKPVKMDG